MLRGGGGGPPNYYARMGKQISYIEIKLNTYNELKESANMRLKNQFLYISNMENRV